ncbi:23S rRNA (guanosine(2251)-2'-O)-methyltransferase RlmB [Thermosulfurimonas sp. F29]|uniref:23S rRNA (guanosine(2251)-2'-O)-methyltransferase RlmB n=1 Tax=Thermosulfurimonas sp. F29 TaxID=2867247 RepID=UPI001C833E65|nr:23S rRNA (guanosine(2251)-2'-O)-methyltransferase RlmB [Thermosulfurimonas sp. F29]MBX6423838.1 23S rRNA (guanosine(2251)-2'-O)-methyltransferase RlmB [Thermosulfurimonas sp. F29]
MSRVVWGLNPVLELLKSQPDKVEEIWLAAAGLRGRRFRVLELARSLEIPVRVVRDFHPPKVPAEARTQGVVAYLREFAYASLDELEERLTRSPAPLVVFLDELTDPQNVGSLIRSAEVFGAHGVVIPKHRAAGVTPTVIKASAGAVFHLPVVRVVNLRQAIRRLREAGLAVYGLSADAEREIPEVDLTGPVGLVVGSEGRGLREGVRRECDELIRIPMRGKIGSLNAAVAGAVALYEVLRQRVLKDTR